MTKKILSLSFAIIAITFAISPMAMAAEGTSSAAYSYSSYIGLGCVVGLGFAAFGGGIGMGNAVNGALNGIARNPGTAGKITTTLLIGLALIESLVIYTLVIALILLFVKPYL
ncbi:MAG: ATP synthase F0 subunit C [Nitrospinae bacterium]|nr:ATP synthase F0 subunit C [Nitrospinota bacterium]MBI3814874.1 ATP synthase F0 subunit C [Nitrospinota bacterium]